MNLRRAIYTFFFNFISLIFLIINSIFKKNLDLKFASYLENKSYQKIKILKKIIIFFCPNEILKWRIDTFFNKEPDTLKWINKFINKKNIVFWDIGANIGLYSIYASIKNKKIKIISFEPSTSNLRVLSRNIFINNLHEKVFICQIALSDKINKFFFFNENKFIEGYALHTLSNNTNYKKIKSENRYKIYSTTAFDLIKKHNFKCPNYIKIDVDGNEYEIIKGFENELRNKNIREILIEIDIKGKNYKKILKLLNQNGFFVFQKYSLDLKKEEPRLFNFLFKKKL